MRVSMMQTNKGHYLGTEIDEKWWKRYRHDHLFARGVGDYWFDDDGFRFRRYLTKEPMVFPYRQMLALKTGYWHGGRWGGGRLIIKIIWTRDGARLSSGFLLSKHEHVVNDIIALLRRRIDANALGRELVSITIPCA